MVGNRGMWLNRRKTGVLGQWELVLMEDGYVEGGTAAGRKDKARGRTKRRGPVEILRWLAGNIPFWWVCVAMTTQVVMRRRRGV